MATPQRPPAPPARIVQGGLGRPVSRSNDQDPLSRPIPVDLTGGRPSVAPRSSSKRLPFGLVGIAVALALFIGILLGLGLRGPSDGRDSVVENEPAAREKGQPNQSKPPTGKPPAPKKAPASAPTRADKSLVLHWLRENDSWLQDPSCDYEVVKWYGPVNFEGYRSRDEAINALAPSGVVLDSWLKLPDSDSLLNRWLEDNQVTLHAIGLKYRLDIPALAYRPSLNRAFSISDGKAREIDWDTFRQQFSDDGIAHRWMREHLEPYEVVKWYVPIDARSSDRIIGVEYRPQRLADQARKTYDRAAVKIEGQVEEPNPRNGQAVWKIYHDSRARADAALNIEGEKLQKALEKAIKRACFKIEHGKAAPIDWHSYRWREERIRPDDDP